MSSGGDGGSGGRSAAGRPASDRDVEGGCGRWSVGGRANGDDEPSGAPYAAALAGLPGAGPATLVALLREWTPEEAWRRVKDGRLRRPASQRHTGRAQLGFDLGGGRAGRGPVEPSPGGADRPDESWRDAARRIDPSGWWVRHADHGVGVTWLGQPEYPEALTNDPEPPGVLFWRGSLGHLARPCVAIVGTRRATPDGRAVAFELGRDLAAAGICVVSGLALGIDGAAHTGALGGAARPDLGGSGGVTGVLGNPARPASGVAGPAGVAASGVDIPYPRRHARLWEQVVHAGVMLSETLPGRPAQAWRFPSRNRIIAGLAAMVVVVESHAAGGSLITAEAAIARGVEVRVVPGPVHSPACAGSNQLLYDGPGPVRDARDVLDGLGIFLSTPRRPVHPGAAPASPADVVLRRHAGRLDDQARHVLDAVSWRPTSLNQVVARSGFPIAAASRVLDVLEAAGMVDRQGQWWVRRPLAESTA